MKKKTRAIISELAKPKTDSSFWLLHRQPLSSEVLFINANHPNDAFVSFQPRIKNVLYDIVALDDRFLIRTNLDALNFKVMECPLNKTTVANWKEVIPHRKDILVQSVDAFKKFTIITERRMDSFNWTSSKASVQGTLYCICEPAYTASLGANPNYFTDSIRFVYTSLNYSILGLRLQCTE